jgi:hypothetical protein
VGVGCIASAWAGSDTELREHLFADLATPQGADALLDPHALVALETVGKDFAKRPRDAAGCSVEGARVTDRPREPGAVEAEIESPSPVDAVIRVAAFRTWRVLVDGSPTETTTVAPGFPSVRVTAGAHHIEAIVSPLPGYLAGIFLALVGAALCSVTRNRRRSPPPLEQSPEATSSGR